jgi:hypothetical protein
MAVRLHPIEQVTAGVIEFDWKQASEVLSNYGHLIAAAPDELTVELSISTGGDGGPALYVAPTWSGPAGDAETWIAKVAGLGNPVMRQVAAMPYSESIKLLDPYVVAGNHYETRTRTLGNLGREAIEALVVAGESRTSLVSGITIHPFQGAATRVGLTDTAFGVRKPHFVVEILAAWEPGDDGAEAHVGWAEAVYADLGQHAMLGGYPNLIGPAQAEQADEAYGPNASRLREIKQRFDPKNVFASATPLPTS